MQSSIINLIVDSDQRERRFRCIEVNEKDPFSLMIEYKQSKRMRFELVSSGNQSIGFSEVAEYLEREMRLLGGTLSTNTGCDEIETRFQIDQVEFHYKHLLTMQLNGDIGHLTILDFCSLSDYDVIRRWFKNLIIMDKKVSTGRPGDLVPILT